MSRTVKGKEQQQTISLLELESLQKTKISLYWRADRSGLQRCADSDFFEAGSNPVLQILNPNPLRIRYQLDSRNPTPV